ncbi:UDP-N-acetylmuramoyl-L-alanine--D-glutamate ligase [Clostridium facile]|uniref:UDP-N-acetylmuramoylalanine--D-glutamate ligase n=1 Tax=Clostridium facile TaxID=2763035 RepID=A0ABR7IN13_9CLOT|nr:UDP-N-acetylmuramoyl-L-alanine--D-glutamate ligase [Clostridium facile]MBC5786525.1 UDP-N-acetylmuramoyl-L-alanine--D-glutamate ligase [Clostridium facile]
MSTKAELFFQEMNSKKIAFIGMGVTNLNIIKLFLSKQLDVTVCDRQTKEKLGKNYDELLALGAKFVLGEDYLETLCDYDVIFRSPGIYFYHPALQKAREHGCVVTTEMEVFFDLCPCKIYAVTGSDGKTTTTTLIGKMLEQQGFKVHVGGNIGKALLPEIETIQPEDIAVVELSSFQIISMRQSPDVAVITNISPNHLDVHKNMEEYIQAKCNLLWHQNAFSKAVLNHDNEITDGLDRYVRGKLCKFSRKECPTTGTWLDEQGYLYLVNNGVKTKLFHKDEIKIPGIHNVENYLAAIAAVCDVVTPETMHQVATTFGGVEHRIELVRELDGVKWYNDSIATSPTRTIAGLNSFQQKIIVIAGGYDKHLAYEPLAPKLVEKVKALVLMGATAPKIEAALLACPGYDSEQLPIYHAENMEQAVQKAKEIAQPGDIVSLSPASASFDLYKNFEVRGNHFKQLVNELQ